jgi:DNA-binding protein H-NS
MPVSLAPLAKSKLKARSAAKSLSVAELEKVIANLTGVLKSEKEKEKNKVEAAKKAKIAKIQALMDESGLKPADLKGVGRGRKKATRKKAKVPPKYRLVVDGTEHLWSGRGRPPKVFKDYMDAGNSKESCAI